MKATAASRTYNPAKSKMVHTWYAYPMESFMAVHAPKAGQFKSWGDFSGKPVFFTPAGFMNWLNFQRIFKALGYQFKHVQIGEAAQGDALQAGTIVGACRLYDRRPVARRPTGARPSCASTSR